MSFFRFFALDWLYSQFKLSDLENSSFKGKPRWGKTGSHDPYHRKTNGGKRL